MDSTIGNTTERAAGADPAQRSAALADARRRASQSALESAAASEARRAEQLEKLQTIIEQVIGANTRLSIQRNDNFNAFVYRAIDVNSGEVVKEWPPVQFAAFLEENGVASKGLEEVFAGVVVDEQA